MTTKIAFNRQGKEISRTTADDLSPFERALVRKGIAVTRVSDLQKGCNALHTALCRLDRDGRAIIAEMGLVGLLDCFAESHEGFRKISDVLKGE